MKTRSLFALAVLSLTAVVSLASAQDTDRWYEIWMAGSRSGWTHETVTAEGDRITTRVETMMSVGRADQAVTFSSTTEFFESAAGEPIKITITQKLGDTPIESTYLFDGGEVFFTSEQGGNTQETTLPWPEGEWLPPAAVARFLAQRLVSGATDITLRTLDPSNGLGVVKVVRTGIASAEIDVLGTATECFLANNNTKIGTMTINATEWLNADGALLRSETIIGGIEMTQIASTRERALQKAEPAEIMVSTFVKPDRKISNARRRSRGVFEVRVKGGTLPELPSSAFQRVETLDATSARVTIDTTRYAPAGEVDREAVLASTTYADAGDELIQQLAQKAITALGDDHAVRAEALRRFVYRHIADKNLGTAFATATETARTGKGDCTEHGVLLAAMLRAVDIPSRVAVGVVYVDRFAGERNVFGYHMWTQALLESDTGPAWVDLDATIDARTPFDATHIAFAVSDLGEGETISSLAGIAPLLGTLEIDVMEIK